MKELKTKYEAFKFYRDRRALWLSVDPEYDEIWDYAEKRVLSDRLANVRPILLQIAAVLRNALLYRKVTSLYSTGAAPSRDITHVILKLSVRPDHDPQIDTISRNLSPEYIITDEDLDLERIAQISLGIRTRAQLVANAFARARTIRRSGLIEAASIPAIANMLLKYYLDKGTGKKIVALLPNTGRKYLVSALTVETHRGIVPPLRQAGVKFATYQHGIRGENGGFPEETGANVCVLWTMRDKEAEHAAVNFRSPPPLEVCPTLEHIAAPTRTKALKGTITKPRITYLSSPNLSFDKDRDRDMMYELVRRISAEDEIPFELTFCLHPSKTIGDYPGLSHCNVVVGLSQVAEAQCGFIGVFSTALIYKALEGKRVASLCRSVDVPDPRTAVPGLPVIDIDSLQHLSGLLDDDGVSPVPDCAAFANHIFGTYRKGDLTSLLAKVYDDV